MKESKKDIENGKDYTYKFKTLNHKGSVKCIVIGGRIEIWLNGNKINEYSKTGQAKDETYAPPEFPISQTEWILTIKGKKNFTQVDIEAPDSNQWSVS